MAGPYLVDVFKFEDSRLKDLKMLNSVDLVDLKIW